MEKQISLFEEEDDDDDVSCILSSLSEESRIEIETSFLNILINYILEEKHEFQK